MFSNSQNLLADISKKAFFDICLPPESENAVF